MTQGDKKIQAEMTKIKKMILFAALIVVVGYILILLAGVESWMNIWRWTDATKMWFKLGGVGHILIGIFISLVAIIQTLKLVPARLGAVMNQKEEER